MPITLYNDNYALRKYLHEIINRREPNQFLHLNNMRHGEHDMWSELFAMEFIEQRGKVLRMIKESR